MQIRKADVAVIGAGTAGLTARREAEAQGASTILIESGPYGTMCARVGCMPSKLLIAAAEAAHGISRAELFGVRAGGPVRVDGAAVMERVRRERDRFAGFVVEDTEKLPAEQRLRGHARFTGPHTLEIEDTRVEAGAIVIATGSRPVIPDNLVPAGDKVVTNDDVFDWAELPDSVAVVGGGIIGLELGQALHRLGVRTRLFVRSHRLGPLSDPEVEASALDIFSNELDVHFDTRVRAEPAPGGARVHWSGPQGSASETYDFVLAAAGRGPVLDSLGLEHTGATLRQDGVPVHDPLTGAIEGTPLFLAGDVTGERALLHEAADEGRIAGFNAAHFPELRAHRRRTPLAVVFSDPQIAVVGTPFHELPEAAAIGSVDYGDQGRARVMGQNRGLVRIYGSREDGRLLGAEMVGPRVEHTAHLLAWAVQLGVSADRALQLPFYHPVVEEGIRTALRGLARELLLTPPPCARDLDCGPGA